MLLFAIARSGLRLAFRALRRGVLGQNLENIVSLGGRLVGLDLIAPIRLLTFAVLDFFPTTAFGTSTPSCFILGVASATRASCCSDCSTCLPSSGVGLGVCAGAGTIEVAPEFATVTTLSAGVVTLASSVFCPVSGSGLGFA
jgi:hypothetical protein